MDHSGHQVDSENLEAQISTLSRSGHHNFFTFRTNFTNSNPILFQSWQPTTKSQYIGTCFAIFFMTIFQYFLLSTNKKLSKNGVSGLKLWSHAVMSCIILGWGYFLMLIVMSYEGWYFVSILVGALIGSLLFPNVGQVDHSC